MTKMRKMYWQKCEWQKCECQKWEKCTDKNANDKNANIRNLDIRIFAGTPFRLPVYDSIIALKCNAAIVAHILLFNENVLTSRIFSCANGRMPVSEKTIRLTTLDHWTTGARSRKMSARMRLFTWDLVTLTRSQSPWTKLANSSQGTSLG